MHYVYGAAVAMLFPDTLCRLVSISVASFPGHTEGEEKTAWYIYTHSAYYNICTKGTQKIISHVQTVCTGPLFPSHSPNSLETKLYSNSVARLAEGSCTIC